MDGVTTPYGVQIAIKDADPLDRLELDSSGANLIIKAYTRDGLKKLTIVLSTDNMQQLQCMVANWLGQQTNLNLKSF